MSRYVLVLLTSMAFSSSATATVTPYKESSPWQTRSCQPLMKLWPAFAIDIVYRITKQTEVMLNGRKCRFEDVPNTAVIILMEIDSETSKVILRIHFRDRLHRP